MQDSLGTDSRWCSLLFEPSSRRLFENVRYAGLSHVCVRSGRDGSERGGLRLAAGGSIEREGVGKLVSKGRARRHCGLMDGGKDKRSDLGWPLLLQLTKDRRPSCECDWVDWYKSLQCFRRIASVSHPVRRWRIPACSVCGRGLQTLNCHGGPISLHVSPYPGVSTAWSCLLWDLLTERGRELETLRSGQGTALALIIDERPEDLHCYIFRGTSVFAGLATGSSAACSGSRQPRPTGLTPVPWNRERCSSGFLASRRCQWGALSLGIHSRTGLPRTAALPIE